jgi:uncharacterized protein (TIGR00730 family)
MAPADPPDNSAQKNSTAYRLAALDVDFLLGDSTRGVRFLLEYSKAEERLRAWGIRSTIVVFGSARILPGGSGDRAAGTAPLPAGAEPRTGSTSAHWYEEAQKFGRIASQKGGSLHPIDGVLDNVIATGGGPGIMEAANRGASEAGAPSIGFNIRLPFEQEPNAFSTPDLTFQFHYFAMRKMHLAMRAAALVVFPGGFGTMDELFEILTLRQTGKAPAIPIILFGRAYWTKVINFEALLAEGMIADHDLALFEFAESAEEAWDCLVAKGLMIRQAPKRDL